jgi:putative hydrolase of the HAD superfamily
MKQRVVVFDVGGVIARWQPLELMRQHLPALDPQDAFVQVFQGWAPHADWWQFDLGHIDAEGLALRISQRSGLDLQALRSLVHGIPTHLQPMPESLALIDTVRAAGHRLAVLSNMPAPFADHLEQHACFAAFEQRVWSGRVGLVKPQAAIYQHVQAQMGAEPEDLVFLDDHLGNVEAAQRLGWQGVHFSTAASATAQLQALGWL